MMTHQPWASGMGQAGGMIKITIAPEAFNHPISLMAYPSQAC
jgi:hypothetical protein